MQNTIEIRFNDDLILVRRYAHYGNKLHQWTQKQRSSTNAQHKTHSKNILINELDVYGSLIKCCKMFVRSVNQSVCMHSKETKNEHALETREDV